MNSLIEATKCGTGQKESRDNAPSQLASSRLQLAVKQSAAVFTSVSHWLEVTIDTLYSVNVWLCEKKELKRRQQRTQTT